MKQNHYDMIVIGGGSAGLTAAFTAKGFGKRVAIIERRKLGGECTWNGCIPSKALIKAAHTAHSVKTAGVYGITSSEINSTHGALNYVRKVIENVYEEETPEVIRGKGVDIIEGEASFASSNTIIVNGANYTADKIIIASGSSPALVPITGLAEIEYYTNENIFSLKEIPSSLIILGGGPIGIELAHAFSRLGSAVTVVEYFDRILPREDEDISRELTSILQEEGLTIMTSAKAVSAKHSGKIELTIERNGASQIITAEKILVATGRKPNIESLKLDNAGIKHTKSGVICDRKMRTSAKNVYACGDVVGPYQFSHMAGHQALTAALNALLPFTRKADYSTVPWVTFTDPELARTGYTEKEAREKFKSVKVFTYAIKNLDRSRTENETKGTAKFILDKNYRILGAHILAANAGELIMEAQLMRSLNIPLTRAQSVIHPYPTRSDLYRQTAKLATLDKLNNNFFIKLLKRLRRK